MEAEAAFKLAMWFQQQGERDRATRYFARAEQLNPNDWNYHRQDWSFEPNAGRKWLEKFQKTAALGALRFVRQRKEQGHRRPARRGIRGKLMPAVGEALERVRLHGHGACGCEPRAVCELIPQQPLYSLLVDGIVGLHAPGDIQGVQRFARGIGVGPDACKLAPASILILSRLQGFHERSAL